MTSGAESKQILQRLDEIKSELDYIKGNMVDIDQVLTEEDKKALAGAEEEYKKGKTTTLEDLKKELGE
ncbi:MAG: hypothetical protein R6U32_00545 [Candidatus Woesearchaeota archaeon]